MIIEKSNSENEFGNRSLKVTDGRQKRNCWGISFMEFLDSTFTLFLRFYFISIILLHCNFLYTFLQGSNLYRFVCIEGILLLYY